MGRYRMASSRELRHSFRNGGRTEFVGRTICLQATKAHLRSNMRLKPFSSWRCKISQKTPKNFNKEPHYRYKTLFCPDLRSGTNGVRRETIWVNSFYKSVSPQSHNLNNQCGLLYRLFSQHFSVDSCICEEETGKVNHPKTSDNLTIGTNKNVAPDYGGKKPR